jgi:hypothetical protein
VALVNIYLRLLLFHLWEVEQKANLISSGEFIDGVEEIKRQEKETNHKKKQHTSSTNNPNFTILFAKFNLHTTKKRSDEKHKNLL